MFVRYPQNPLLSVANWPYRINGVFNAGAVLLQDGTTLLLCRVEDRRGHSHLCAARSPDGVGGWEIDQMPTMVKDPEGHPEELWGIEDPRISRVEELGKYVIAYTAYSPAGPAISLALTEDFRSFERLGVIIPPEDKDAALFPRRIGGYWALAHRPVISSIGAYMWVSFSPDLQHWGRHKVVLPTRPGWWDASKVGLGPPPIETPEGWLVLYHGVRQTSSGMTYRLGAALLDLDDPTRCVRRGDDWIFAPETPYERNGDVNNVIFPCGYTLAPDGDRMNLYYGAADSRIALATGSIRSILEWLEKHGS